MPEEPNALSNEFKIKFDGQLYQVDAKTFINSLMSISTVVQEVNQELSSDKKIEIKIKAVEKGSFIAVLSLQELSQAAQSLFNGNNLQVGAEIITILVGLYELKKFLGGKKPKSVKEEADSVKIENGKGTIQLIDNRTYSIFVRNQSINDAISNNFSTLEEDPSVSAFEILDFNNRPIFTAKKEEFDELSIKSEVEDAEKRSVVVVATIVIHKIVFEERYKWEFYYKANKISANIEDETFFEKINSGEERFAKGDKLNVDLQINQVFDPSVNIYINHSYQINKVLEHIPRDEQLQIEIDDDENL